MNTHESATQRPAPDAPRMTPLSRLTEAMIYAPSAVAIARDALNVVAQEMRCHHMVVSVDLERWASRIDRAITNLGGVETDQQRKVIERLRDDVQALVDAALKAKAALLTGQPQVHGDDTVYPLDGALCGSALNALRAALARFERAS